MSNPIQSDFPARRRRRAGVLVGALAVMLAAGGLGAAIVHRSDAPLLDRTTEVPAAPAGMKWVGIGREVVAVPAGWPVLPGLVCGGPGSPYVTILGAYEESHAYSCNLFVPQNVPHIRIAAGGSHLGTGGGPTTELPAGWSAVPAGRPDEQGAYTATSVSAALEAAGFRVDRRAAPVGSVFQQVTTDPAIGSPARVGSTVTVYDHGAAPASARLNGTVSTVGGPAPGTAQAFAGIVHVTNADRSFEQFARADSDGRWTLAVPPGTYGVTADGPGTAPSERDACHAAGPVTVSAGQTANADVLCQLR